MTFLVYKQFNLPRSYFSKKGFYHCWSWPQFLTPITQSQALLIVTRFDIEQYPGTIMSHFIDSHKEDKRWCLEGYGMILVPRTVGRGSRCSDIVIIVRVLCIPPFSVFIFLTSAIKMQRPFWAITASVTHTICSPYILFINPYILIEFAMTNFQALFRDTVCSLEHATLLAEIEWKRTNVMECWDGRAAPLCWRKRNSKDSNINCFRGEEATNNEFFMKPETRSFHPHNCLKWKILNWEIIGNNRKGISIPTCRWNSETIVLHGAAPETSHSTEIPS